MWLQDSIGVRGPAVGPVFHQARDRTLPCLLSLRFDKFRSIYTLSCNTDSILGTLLSMRSPGRIYWVESAGVRKSQRSLWTRTIREAPVQQGLCSKGNVRNTSFT